MSGKRKRVACIGGGTGQAQILKALQKYPLNVTGIVGVTDNGGHSGELRRLFDIPQVGDLRNCLAALADAPPLLTYRFSRGKMAGASLGNLMIVALAKRFGSLLRAIDYLRGEWEIRPRLLPVSEGNSHICARLKDGRIIRGEWEIIRRKPRTPINRLFHAPEMNALPEAVRAIRSAHLIIVCPGSLRTGIISALLARGIKEALKKSRATKVQIGNIMTQPGNTDGFTAKDHLDLIERYMGAKIDVFIANTKQPPSAWLTPYRQEGSHSVKVRPADFKERKLITGNFLESPSKNILSLYRRPGPQTRSGPHFIRHDADKIGKLLFSLA